MANSGANRTAFLTVAEVADMVRVSRMTVYRWIHTGELPAVRFGRSFRVPQQAVEAFMEQAEPQVATRSKMTTVPQAR